MSGTPAAPQPQPLGAKTAPILLALFQDVYRQEVGAEEDVHRTLPFFATALGFVIAAINYSVGQLPSLDSLTKAYPSAVGGVLNHHVLAHTWPVLLAICLLVVASALGVGVLGYLAAATRRLNYRRIGPEAIYLSRADAFLVYHARLGRLGVDLDEAVSVDIRQQLLDDYVDVITQNRRLTLRRYEYRARAVSCLLLSLLFALLATMSVLITTKTGLMPRV